MDYRGNENFNNANSLQHWKYLKKEKVNGKWRYYYDYKQLGDDLGVDELQRYTMAKLKYDVASSKSREANRKVRNFMSYTNNLPDTREGAKEYQEAFENNRELFWDNQFWKEAAKTRGEQYMQARSDLYKTPIGKVVKASNAVKDFVSSIFDRFGR